MKMRWSKCQKCGSVTIYSNWRKKYYCSKCDEFVNQKGMKNGL